jgi:hypothetical protein
MRVALAIGFGGLVAFVGCSSGTDGGGDFGGQVVRDDGGGGASDVGAPAQDAGGGGGGRDAAVHGKHIDSGTNGDDASVGGGGGKDSGDTLSVMWGKACWEVQNGQRFQAISFDLTTPTPVPLEATLFLTAKCNSSAGTENFNDVGTTITSGSYAYWFIHHPDETNTSATWSIGNLTTGCVDYAHAQDCR